MCYQWNIVGVDNDMTLPIGIFRSCFLLPSPICINLLFVMLDIQFILKCIYLY